MGVGTGRVLGAARRRAAGRGRGAPAEERATLAADLAALYGACFVKTWGGGGAEGVRRVRLEQEGLHARLEKSRRRRRGVGPPHTSETSDVSEKPVVDGRAGRSALIGALLFALDAGAAWYFLNGISACVRRGAKCPQEELSERTQQIASWTAHRSQARAEALQDSSGTYRDSAPTGACGRRAPGLSEIVSEGLPRVFRMYRKHDCHR